LSGAKSVPVNGGASLCLGSGRPRCSDEPTMMTMLKAAIREGIYWELLEEEKLKSIPILRKLRGES